MVTRKRLPHFIHWRNGNNLFSSQSLSILTAIVFTLACAPVRSTNETTDPVDRNSLRLLPLAKAYLQKGEAVPAQNLLETLLELYPDDAEAHLYLGEAYAAEKKYPMARLQFS